ncbi:MAG: hypothetical protein ACLFNZ_06610 [Spirochaetaceae bacterium]
MSSSSPEGAAETEAGASSEGDTPSRLPVHPPFLRTFTQENAELTGIRISRARSGQQRRLMQIEERVGYRVSGGEVQQWRWKGTIEADGFLYACFPVIADPEALSRLSYKNPDTALQSAESFFYSYSLLRGKDQKAADALTPETVLFDSRGSWYFLPPKLSSIISEEINPEYKNHFITETDPRKRLTAAVLFSLYRVFTGHYPTDKEEAVPSHPHLYTPELTKDCSRLIFLPFSEKVIPSPEDAGRWIALLRREGWRERIDEQERLQRVESARETLRKKAQQHRIKTSLRRYAPPAALGAAAVGVLFFLFFPFSGGTTPDPTEGLKSEEVVRLYYNSISSLDHETMDACTAGRREFHYMKEVTNLFVIARVRQGVEHTDSFLTAEEWLDEGSPPLSNHIVVYGISNLTIVDKEKPGEEERRYTVEFDKYSTIPVEEEEEEAVSTGTVEVQEITESLTLIRTSDGGWKITDIHRIREKGKERVRPEE